MVTRRRESDAMKMPFKCNRLHFGWANHIKLNDGENKSMKDYHGKRSEPIAWKRHSIKSRLLWMWTFVFCFLLCHWVCLAKMTEIKRILPLTEFTLWLHNWCSTVLYPILSSLSTTTMTTYKRRQTEQQQKKKRRAHTPAPSKLLWATNKLSWLYFMAEERFSTLLSSGKAQRAHIISWSVFT